MSGKHSFFMVPDWLRQPDEVLDEPLPSRPTRTPVNRNGIPPLVPYKWRPGEAARDAEVDAKVLELRAEAARRRAARGALMSTEWQ